MDLPPIATLVDHLFKTHRHPSGRELTYHEVSVASGGVLQSTHIQKLRRGEISDPRRSTIVALCRAFNVPILYFFGEQVHEPPEAVMIPAYVRVHR